MRVRATSLLAFSCAISIAVAASADIYPLNSRATYLHTNQDLSAAGALAIPLSERAYAPGTWITITALGDFKVGGAYNDEYVSMGGVFSSSNMLLEPGAVNRVPGAIEAGTDYITSPTWFGAQPTDIAADFAIGLSDTQRSVTLPIPDGASWLIVGILESHYSDNTDPDGDLAVAINAVPEPSSVALLALGWSALVRRRGSRR